MSLRTQSLLVGTLALMLGVALAAVSGAATSPSGVLALAALSMFVGSGYLYRILAPAGADTVPADSEDGRGRSLPAGRGLLAE